MNTSLQLFNFKNQPIRVVMIDGEPWFIASDVCQVLDIVNVSQAVESLDEDERNTISIRDGIRGNPNKLCINEPGLYGLVLVSRKSEAKEFKRWLKWDVLPSIRKTGSYSVPTGWINDKFARRQEKNHHLRVAGRFTIDEATDDMAASRVFQGLDFSSDAFPDTSIGKGFWPWVNAQGYDLSDVDTIEHLVNWDSLGSPIYEEVYSYPNDPFKLYFDNYLRLEYWPNRFMPYLKRKYKGQERVKNIESAEKLIEYLTADKTHLLKRKRK